MRWLRRQPPSAGPGRSEPARDKLEWDFSCSTHERHTGGTSGPTHRPSRRAPSVDSHISTRSTPPCAWPRSGDTASGTDPVRAQAAPLRRSDLRVRSEGGGPKGSNAPKMALWTPPIGLPAGGSRPASDRSAKVTGTQVRTDRHANKDSTPTLCCRAEGQKHSINLDPSGPTPQERQAMKWRGSCRPTRHIVSLEILGGLCRARQTCSHC